MRAMVWVAASPLCSQVSPPSVVSQTPAPAIELRKMLASPVPTHSRSGSFGSSPRAPIEVVTA